VTSRGAISAKLREAVAERAERRCEYCLISEEQAFARHQVDHVIAVKHGGKNTLDNLYSSYEPHCPSRRRPRIVKE